MAETIVYLTIGYCLYHFLKNFIENLPIIKRWKRVSAIKYLIRINWFSLEERQSAIRYLESVGE